MRELLLNVLDEIGIAIDDNERNMDFDLSEFFIDSIQFISFIVEVEKRLGFELPDDFLLIEQYRSFNALCNVLTDINENKNYMGKEVYGNGKRTEKTGL